MATKSFSTTESTNQTQSVTVTISDLSTADSVSVTNGSASITDVTGTNVTVQCSGGASTRNVSGTHTENETKTQACYIKQKYMWSQNDFAWYEYQSRFNDAPSSIKASDGVSDLLLNSVTEDSSPRPPGANGSYDGQVLTGAFGDGTATYKGTTVVTGTTYYYQYSGTITYTPLPTTGGALEKIKQTTDSITLRIKNLEFGSGYTLLNISRGASPQAVSVEGSSGLSYYSSQVTFTGLSPGTSYSFTAHFTHSGQQAGSDTASFSTDQLTTTGSLAKVAGSTNSLTAKITGLAYNSGYTTLSITANGVTKNVSVAAGGSAGNYESTTAEFTNLVANTPYAFSAAFSYPGEIAGSASANYSTDQTTTAGTVSALSGATASEINVRITGLAYGNGYSVLEIIGPDPASGSTKTQAVSIAGSSAGSYYSTTAAFSGLTAGASYPFTARFQHTGEKLGTSSNNFSTDKATTSGLLAFVSKTDTTIKLNITNLQYNSGYTALNIVGPDNQPQNVSIAGGSAGNYYSTDVTFSGLTPETTYSFTANFTASGEYAGSSTSSYTTNTSAVTGGTIELVTPANESTLNVRITNLEFPDGYTQLVITGPGNVTQGVSIMGSSGVAYYTSAATFSGLLPLTSYSFTAKFTHTGQAAGTSSASYSTAAHVDVAPTLNFSAIDGVNAVTITFSGYDQDGLRDYDTFGVQISGPNDTSYGPYEYLTDSRNNINQTHTFQSDSLGHELQSGKTYTVRVIVYDMGDRYTYSTKSVVVSYQRPANFSWTNPKTIGVAYNLTAAEWNGLLNKVNAFQKYKGVEVTTFDRTMTGTSTYVIPTDLSYNAVIDALLAMNPPISPPSKVTTWERVTAYHFTQLRASLNSITNP